MESQVLINDKKILAPHQFAFVDLFAGIGGMRLAFEEAGGRCILTCEIDAHATKTYQENFRPEHNHFYAKDICALSSSDIPEHDVLVAGFPCQPYSMAGLRKGLKDARGQVFLEIIRILQDKQPKAFLLENVKGMVAHDGGKTFKFMCESLESVGYSIKHKILNSMTHANIPQNRERVFIVGMRNQIQMLNFEFPTEKNLQKNIHDCLDPSSVTEKHIYTDRFGCYSTIVKSVTKTDTIYQWRRQYVRENKSKACPTLTANMGSGGHNVPLVKDPIHGIRKLTPREVANFQGFPINFKLPKNIAESKLYHQFGNSVTVPLIERIAQNIARAISIE